MTTFKTLLRFGTPGRTVRDLLRDRSGLALIEFAYSLPVLVLLTMGGAELANFITVKMRVSQIALHVADHGARMGTGSVLAGKTVTESEINDLFVGAGLQSGELGVLTNGRIILSSLEPMASPNTTDRYKISWQRCKGGVTYPSSYGVQGARNLTGMGSATRLAKAPDYGATMFVELRYSYSPLLRVIPMNFGPFTETAAMPVRDALQTSMPTNAENATVSTCA